MLYQGTAEGAHALDLRFLGACRDFPALVAVSRREGPVWVADVLFVEDGAGFRAHLAVDVQDVEAGLEFMQVLGALCDDRIEVLAVDLVAELSRKTHQREWHRWR